MNTWNNNCIGLFLMLKNNMIYIHYKKKLNLSITAISALQKLKSYAPINANFIEKLNTLMRN